MKCFLLIPALAFSVILYYSQEKPDQLPRVYPCNSIFLELGTGVSWMLVGTEEGESSSNSFPHTHHQQK